MTTTTPVHTLYRFFNEAGTLLYVGRTIDARSRFRAHERQKEWFDQVSRIDRVILPSAEALAKAEITAIRSESPLYNIQHATTPRTRATLMAVESDGMDPRITRRWLAVGVDTPPAPCDEGHLDTDCECVKCVELHLDEIDHQRDRHEDDEVVMKSLVVLEQEYLDGAEPIDWLYDLDDVLLFRRFHLIERSKATPSPALGYVADGALTVDCPFCTGAHLHFMEHGSAIEDLTAPCLGEGRYSPSLNYAEFLDSSATWLRRAA